MPVDEADRHALYDALTRAIGERPTSVLMTLIPPVAAADVASTQDVEMLRLEFRADFETLRGELAISQRRQTVTMVGAMLSIATITTIAGALL